MKIPTFVDTAKLNDIFIIIKPAEEDMHRLRDYQEDLQALFGGWVYEDVHLTCQRFAVQGDAVLSDVVNALKEQLSSAREFPVVAESLTVFYSPFWETRLLRWGIQKTSQWQDFRAAIDEVLTNLGFAQDEPLPESATCTALEEIPVVNLENDSSPMEIDQLLFKAREVVISQIQGPRKFKILERFQLGGEQ